MRPRPDRRIWSSETSRQPGPTSCGSRTSPTSPPGPASSTSPSSWTCSAGSSWAGRPPGRFALTSPWTPLRWRSGLGRATSTASCTIPIEAANPVDPLHGAPRRSRSGHLGREPWRQLRQRARRDDLRPLQDRADPSPWTVEGNRRRRVLDARVGRLVQPPSAPRTGRRRPAGRVRGRLPKEGGPQVRCRTQGTEPPVNPGRFTLCVESGVARARLCVRDLCVALRCWTVPPAACSDIL
jgi:hypothetical protein